jgi:hypothetical protein
MKYFILFFFAIAIFAGCTKQSNPVTNYIYTHSDSALVGDMVGYVSLYDSTYFNFENYIPNTNSSGVTISLDGMPFKTMSDSTGRWMMKNIPAAIYNIAYNKPGFATEKQISYPFIGNGTGFIGKINLYQVPILHPSLVIRPFADGKEGIIKDTFYININGDTVIYRKQDSIFTHNGVAVFTGSASESNNGEMSISFSLFLGKTPNLDPRDPNSYITKLLPSDYTNNFRIYRDSLYDAGFKASDQVYCILAAETQQCFYYAYYFDINTGKNIYTGFSPIHSDVKNFILP